MLKTITAIIVGALLGILGARYLFVGSAVSLILWAIAGLLIGMWSDTRRQAMLNGGLFGFVLSFDFMLSGYAGSEPVLSRFPFFALLGLFGAGCGLVLGWIGFFLKSKLTQRKRLS